MNIDVVKASDWLDQAEPLMRQHWEEVMKPLGLPEINLQRDMMLRMEAAGITLSLAAIAGEALVGYSFNIVGRSYSMGHVCCQNEGIFVAREHRGKLALRLIKETRRAAIEAGAKRMIWHTYNDTRAQRLFSRLGCSGHDVCYSEDLNHA